MKKFFLFKRRDVNLASTSVSDNGEGLDVLAVPVDSLAFMTAEYGKILIVFNGATIYEESKLLDGESFKKTSVYVSCKPGSEADLIEDILKFISAEKTTSNVMRFDAVLGKATAAKAVVNDFTDVVSKVKQYPVSRVSQEPSTKTFIGGTDGTSFGTDNEIGDIDFGEGNKPDIDFVETGMSHASSKVNGWVNDGAAGSSYNCSVVSGNIDYISTPGLTTNGLSTESAKFDSTAYLTLGTAYRIKSEFTFFCVYGKTKDDFLSSKFVGSVAQSVGGSSRMFMSQYDISSFSLKFRNAEDLDSVLTAKTQRPLIKDSQTAYVFIVRRDADSNIFFHDSSGSVVATIPAVISGNVNRTDGEFSLGYLGNGGGTKFQGNVARLGIISKDIGISAASKLAVDLAKKYTPKI